MKKNTEKPLFTPEDLEISLYDTVEFLDSDEAIAGHLSISLLEDFDPDIFLHAIGNALRAKSLNTTESLLKVAQYMRPPVDSSESASAVGRSAGKSVKKPAARKKVPSPNPRRRREAALA